MQHAHARRIELGAAMHLALEVLEPADLPFDLAAAPGRAEGGAHRREIGFEPGREAPKFNTECTLSSHI